MHIGIDHMKDSAEVVVEISQDVQEVSASIGLRLVEIKLHVNLMMSEEGYHKVLLQRMHQI